MDFVRFYYYYQQKSFVRQLWAHFYRNRSSRNGDFGDSSVAVAAAFARDGSTFVPVERKNRRLA